MRQLPLIAAIVLLLSAATACREEKKEVLSGEIDPETFPTMMTRRVETLISDSGVTRYRIRTPLWLVFDEAREPRWFFPDSLELIRYDDLLRVDATVNCDSATYFRNPQLWRLDGNVRIANMAGERFLTNQLFWDQRRHTIYSDSFIHIEKSDRIIEGYGFTSNEQMTDYTVRNVQGIFPTSDFTPGKQPAPAAAADTTAAAGRPAPQPAPQPAAKPAPASRNTSSQITPTIAK